MGEQAGALLRERGETVSVAEGASGGLISAALLAVPGASAYYVGGAVIYTAAAKRGLLANVIDTPRGMRGATEEWTLYLARAPSGHDSPPPGASARAAPPAPPIPTATRPATRGSR